MEFYLPNIAFYVMALLVSSLLLYVVGRTIACLLPEWRDDQNAFQTTFNSYMLGYVSILPLYAIIWNKGNSVFWVVVLLWLIYILWWRKPRKAEWIIAWKTELKALALSTCLLLGCFAFLYYFCFVRSEGQMFSDQIYFSNLAQSIIDNHNESLFRTSISYAQMYHWGDSVTTALWTLVFQAKPIYILYCVTYTFLLAMCIFGLVAIAKGMSKSLPIILCLVLGILYFFYWNLSSLLTPWHGGTSISGLKGYLMIVFSIWGATFVLKGQYSQGFFAALMLVAFYTPLAAGIMTLVCLLSLFMLDRPKLTIRELFNPYVLGSIIITLCFGIIYLLQPDVFTMETFQSNPYHSNMWVMGFIVKRICRPIAAITPIAIVVGSYMYLRKKEALKKYAAFYLCILTSCLIACVVGGFAVQRHIDGGQIATNYYGTISSLFIFVSLIYILSELASKYRYAVYTIIVVISIAYPSYFFYNGAKSSMFPVSSLGSEEREAYLSLQSIFEEHPAKEFGYFRNYTLPENHNTAKTEYDLYFPMDRMVHLLPNGYCPYCLSVYDLPDDINPIWNNMEKSELWQFGEKWKEQYATVGQDEMISSFIEDKNINYIIVEKGASLPQYLSSSFKQVIEWDCNKVYYKE